MTTGATLRARAPVAPTGGAGGEDAGVEVVVVAFGAPELLSACLDRLEGAYPVTVVDNSSDAAVRAVAEGHDARYVNPGRNLGFAAGVNRGLAVRTRPAADVLLLNPDATITPDGVAHLARLLHASDDLACVAPAQVDADGRPARVAWPFPTPLRAWVEALGFGAFRRGGDFMIGSVLLVRAGALEQVGPLDERYFLYAEETDWQQRARQLGWRAELCPAVTATHVGAGTGGEPDRREARFHASQELYVRTYHGRLGWAVYRAGVLAGALARAVVLRGARRRQAAARFRLYRLGPSTVADRLPPAVGPGQDGSQAAPARRATLSLTHVVVSDAFAGVERYVCQVAGELARRGHRVTVVGGDPARMRTELGPAVAFRPAPSLLVAARAIPAGGGSNDLVHAHMTAAEGAAWLARPFTGAPVVATRHFARERGSSAPARAFARITSRALSRDIAISRFVADSVKGPTVLIRNGVADRPPAALESPTVVMLQRLDPEKMPDIGIRAWARSELGELGWRLVVAGTGGLGPALEHLVEELGVADSVSFVGRVDGTERILADASILLAPAPAEPFGLSVVEAMAHGVPVVAADGGAHRETLGEDGLLFPAADPDAAAAALVALADDPGLRHAVGGRLRRRQQEQFSLARHVDELEELYRQVVARSVAAR